MPTLTLKRTPKSVSPTAALDVEVCLVIMLSMSLHGNYKAVKNAVKRLAAMQHEVFRDYIYENWVHIDDVYAKAKAFRSPDTEPQRSGGLVERAVTG